MEDKILYSNDQPVFYNGLVWYVNGCFTLTGEISYFISRYCDFRIIKQSDLRIPTLQEISELAPKHRFILLDEPCNEKELPEYYGKTIIRADRIQEKYNGTIVRVSPVNSKSFLLLINPLSAPTLEDLTDDYIAYKEATDGLLNNVHLTRRVTDYKETFTDDKGNTYSREELSIYFKKVFGMIWRYSSECDAPLWLPFLRLEDTTFVMANDGKPALN
jgi:hypothetical protein